MNKISVKTNEFLEAFYYISGEIESMYYAEHLYGEAILRGRNNLYKLAIEKTHEYFTTWHNNEIEVCNQIFNFIDMHFADIEDNIEINEDEF